MATNTMAIYKKIVKNFSIEEYDLVVKAIWWEWRNNPIHTAPQNLLGSLTEPSLLDLASQTALQYEPQVSTKGTQIFLDIEKHPELHIISNDNIEEIISWLEDVEQVIKDLSPEDHYLPSIPFTPYSPYPRFSLRVLPAFDNWYDAHIFKRNQKLEDLDPENLNNIYCLVADIYKKFQISCSPEVEVNFLFNTDASYNHRDAMNFLVERHIVLDCTYRSMGWHGETAIINIDVKKFVAFKAEINKLMGKGSPTDNLPTSEPPRAEIPQAKETMDMAQLKSEVYTLTYDETTGEISINNKMLKKTQMDSLPDKVFTFLNKNQNRNITINELKKATREDIKDLPKAIEAPGSIGKLLKAFFRVSKTGIYFKPQITKADADKLKITPLLIKLLQ